MEIREKNLKYVAGETLNLKWSFQFIDLLNLIHFLIIKDSLNLSQIFKPTNS